MAPAEFPDNHVTIIVEFVADIDRVVASWPVVFQVFLFFRRDGYGGCLRGGERGGGRGGWLVRGRKGQGRRTLVGVSETAR
jgi:hypothetical protein